MIFPGNVKSMGRYTMTTQPGALSRAAFEEPVDMLVSTALSGKRDDLSGCSSAAVCGITPQIGTGCNFHLRVTLTENVDTMEDANNHKQKNNFKKI